MRCTTGLGNPYTGALYNLRDAGNVRVLTPDEYESYPADAFVEGRPNIRYNDVLLILTKGC